MALPPNEPELFDKAAVDNYFQSNPLPNTKRDSHLVIDDITVQGHKVKVLHLRKLSVFETVLAKFGFGPAAFKNVVNFCYQRNIVHSDLKNKIDTYNNTHILKFKKITTSEVGKADGMMESEPEMQNCTREEILALQDQIVNTNPKHTKLNLETLSQFSEHKITLGDVTYYCSKPFMLNSKTSIIALVKIGDKVYPRIFYKSDSQACWRAMPAVKKFPILGHIHKGIIESDTQLPLALNLALLRMNDRLSFAPSNLADIVKTQFLSPVTYIGKVNIEAFAWTPENAPQEFIKEGMNIPIPPNPQDIKMPKDKNKHPDFSKALQTKDIDVKNYGKLTAKVFASKDKTIQYLFYEDSSGKAFLAGVEKVKDSPINDYGARAIGVNMKGMTAPLLEYRQQIAPGFEPRQQNYRSEYDSNWNYVRELEIIKMYYNEQNKPIPDRV